MSLALIRGPFFCSGDDGSVRTAGRGVDNLGDDQRDGLVYFMANIGLAAEVQDASGLQGLLALGQIDSQTPLGQHARQMIGGDAHTGAGT